MRGEAIYSRVLLSIYDIVVLNLSLPWVWDCSKRSLLDFYNQHTGCSHLDIGVGTGYFLDQCRFPCRDPRLVLMDLNPNCLEFASRRLTRYNPETRLADVLHPVPAELGRFDSIGLCLLIHCLAGTITEKAAIFGHLKRLLNTGGVVFGATVLAKQVRLTRRARFVSRRYNSVGIFSNLGDDEDGLRSGLAHNFSRYGIQRCGAVALFWGGT
jgi:ubiquinone/menaquinone biosynthesis C-methylase UbiE